MSPSHKYPICEKLPCGCYRETWEDTVRTDFCLKHARELAKK